MTAVARVAFVGLGARRVAAARSAPFRALGTVAILLVAACGGSSSNPLAQGGGCSGTAPRCYGSDLDTCCSTQPTGNATCENGEWVCGPAGAPGCNGASCVASADGGTGCIGTPPECYGNDLQSCCSQDPAGPATCEGGQWRCGGAAAPGCSGTSCVSQTAGPFACGPRTCAGSEYCEVQPGGVGSSDGGSDTSYACIPIPSSCAATPTCACIEASDPCPFQGGTCTESASANVMVGCVGG